MEDFFEEGYLEPEKIKEEIESKKPKSTNMFKTMATIVNKNYFPSYDEIEKINSFMMIRYISNDPNGVQMALYLDYFHKTIPLQAQYRFLRYSLSNKISYIKFPAKEKADDQEELDIICKHYKANQILGMRYIKLLPRHILDELVQRYTSHGQIGNKVNIRGKK